MMTTVTEMSDYRPHLLVLTLTADGDAHVLPRSLVQDVVEGKKPPDILGKEVLIRIVEEWLEHVSPNG